MKNYVRVALLALSIVLSGCTSIATIRSDVTVFHAWPTELSDKSYAFAHEKSQEGDLEYQSYQQLLRAELQRLGFTETADTKAAALRVAFDYDLKVRDVRVIQPIWVDPYGYGSGFYAPRLHRFGGFYDPFYDPFWYGPPVLTYQQIDYQLYSRQLHVGIVQARDGKKLYEVTVTSEGRNGALAFAMPYMMRSAFADFPGKSGVARQVEIRFKDPIQD